MRRGGEFGQNRLCALRGTSGGGPTGYFAGEIPQDNLILEAD